VAALGDPWQLVTTEFTPDQPLEPVLDLMRAGTIPTAIP
jgi:hypothetical protein